jgi:type IV pilus assembly protein PilM
MGAVNLVGLDIGSMSIRAAETTRGRNGSVITNFGHVPLADGVVQSGVIHDEKAVTAALKQLWTSVRFGSRKVVLGVTNPQLVVRPMAVTNLPPRQLRKALPHQVRDALPLPIERSLLDFYPLEEVPTGETVRGLLIAAPKDAVITAVHAVERAGLHVARVDVASFALLRAASRLDAGVEGIVDIGAQTTTVVAHTNGEPLIVRTIPRGGAEITELIANRLGVSEEEAEMRKRHVGLVAGIDEPTAAAVREAVKPLVNEIRSSFSYVSTGERTARVTQLALSGGGAVLPGLVEALRTQLHIDVTLADPTARLRNTRRPKPESLTQLRSSAAVSIGLTLGAA